MNFLQKFKCGRREEVPRSRPTAVRIKTPGLSCAESDAADKAAMDPCNDRDVFQNENWRSVITYLDNGYFPLVNLKAFLITRNEAYRKLASTLRQTDKDFISKLDKIVSTDAYTTTKAMQISMSQSGRNEADQIERRCEVLAKLIDDFRKEINRFYVTAGKESKRRHHQSEDFESRFDNARSVVRRLKIDIEKREQRKREAQSKVEQLENQIGQAEASRNFSETKINALKDKRTKLEQELKSLQSNLSVSKNELSQEQERYRRKAIEIIKEIQDCEKSRLELMREIINKFFGILGSDEQSRVIAEQYARAQRSIRKQQVIEEDLSNWHRLYVFNQRTRVNAKNIPTKSEKVKDGSDSDSEDLGESL